MAEKTTNALLLRIGGDELNFELEHRIFNISSFLLTTFAVIGGIGNYFTGLHIMTVWLSFIGALLSGYIFYWSRIKNFFSIKTTLYYVGSVIITLGLMFYFNGGTQGTIVYLIIMLLNIFLLIVPISYQVFVSTVLYCFIFLLILFEFFYPGWVVPYHSKSEMLVDHAVTVSYSVFYTTVLIVIFRNKYLKDREKILSQNDSLILLNEQISLQKQELELKTTQLELSIESANERNHYIETLLKELNHRVKNNLQLVSSLLQKQANSSDESVKSALLDTKKRLTSLILLHQRLYGHENTTSIFMPKYLKELAESILVSFNNLGEENISYDTEEVWLNVELAISVGLIANELITNAFKHAFHKVDEPGLTITFKKNGRENRLSITDNGTGIQENRQGNSFGMELIGLLTKQLKGTFEKDCKDGRGCCFTITFSDFGL